MWMISRYFDERIERHPHRIDYAGAALLAAGTGTLMFVLIMAGNLPAPVETGLGALSVLLIAGLVAFELSTKEPMMPLRLCIASA